MGFKGRSHLRDIKARGKAACAGVEAEASGSENLAQVIYEGGYKKRPIFNVEETVLEEDAIWQFHSSKGGVNAWLQRSKGQAGSLVRG